MYHYKARAYHPAQGRFLQNDPAGYSAGMNLYAYVGGDPVNRVDPSGMCPWATTGQEYGLPWVGPSDCPYVIPPQWLAPNDPGGGDNSGGSGQGGGSQEPQEKCWNGEQGNAGDLASGMGRKIGNDAYDLGRLLNPIGGLAQSLLVGDDPFGANNTNMGMLGADLAPAVEILGTGGVGGAARYAGLRGGSQGAREFMGLVGNRSIQLDHVFIQRGAGGNSYWNLFPTDAALNRLMGQANNYTLSTAGILRGALARFLQNGKLGAAAGGSLGAGTSIGAAIAASGCN